MATAASQDSLLFTAVLMVVPLFWTGCAYVPHRCAKLFLFAYPGKFFFKKERLPASGYYTSIHFPPLQVEFFKIIGEIYLKFP